MNSTRRKFLGTTAIGTLGLAGGGALAQTDKKTIRIGVIGVGWYGMVDAKAALKAGGAEITAICDVDSVHLKTSADELEKLQGTRPQEFKLYEEMLSAGGIDAIIIGTPPQWHALQLMASLKNGYDVYCEKPLAYDIREGRAMVDAVKASDRIVQIGFQRRQSPVFAQVKEAIDAGRIGRVIQAEAQIHYQAGTSDPTPVDPPACLDWELWCGPGPKIPYSVQVGHKSWRLEQTSGHGHLVDWGIHNIDATRLMLDLGMPKQITAAGGIYQYKGIITTPDTLTVNFEFDRCPVIWRHRIWGAAEYTPETKNGIFIYGTKGTIFASDNRWEIILSAKGESREEVKLKSDMGTDHVADFLECVRTRKQPSCPIQQGFNSTATVQLAMIAYETASVVNWNSQTEQITDNPEAAALLKRDYRKPWQHPCQG
ncbi:MAG: Gfo/Idh/MocA family oxidoreductase [Kiritimatiellae bacterium]|nr:Gfo/Idh/MocA family oxidoreductase [Kiritimatiellia bacterium]